MAPKVLDEATIDQVEEQVDADLQEADELVFNTVFRPDDHVGDLGDGGQVGIAKVYPTSGGEARTQWGSNVLRQKGRPVARMAYRWDGAESLLPLSWNPEGTRHDRAQKYLLKRHCERCGESGFTLNARTGNSCPRCGASGNKVIIACYYLKFADVPHKIQRYGHVDCFLVSCVRRGEYGFIDEAAMRMHAGMKHTRQYQAFEEARRSSNQSEVEVLRGRLDNLMLLLAKTGQPVATEPEAAPTKELPLYVSGKDKDTKQPGRRANTRVRTIH